MAKKKSKKSVGKIKIITIPLHRACYGVVGFGKKKAGRFVKCPAPRRQKKGKEL